MNTNKNVMSFLAYYMDDIWAFRRYVVVVGGWGLAQIKPERTTINQTGISRLLGIWLIITLIRIIIRMVTGKWLHKLPSYHVAYGGVLSTHSILFSNYNNILLRISITRQHESRLSLFISSRKGVKFRMLASSPTIHHLHLYVNDVIWRKLEWQD